MNTHQNDKSKFGGGGEEQGGRQEPTSKGHSPIPQVCISSKATVFLYFFMQFNKAPPPPFSFNWRMPFPVATLTPEGNKSFSSLSFCVVKREKKTLFPPKFNLLKVKF